MISRTHFLASSAAAALCVLSAQALAQQAGTMQVGEATVSVGGGVANLWLPDRDGLVIKNAAGATVRTLDGNDDFGDEYGGSFSGSIVAPWGDGMGVAVSGFFSSIDDRDRVTCTSTSTAMCGNVNIVDDPTAANTVLAPAGTSITSNSKREVDNWGVSIEARRYTGGYATGFLSTSYFALGADIRGLDQDVAASGSGTADPSATGSYTESLDTRYYGAYLAAGGEYSLPFIGGLTSGWGLRSFFTGHIGVYYADTDYSGAYSATATGFSDTGRLSLDEQNAAVIAGLKLETRKQIGARAALSLLSEYEYYSWVPDMKYNDRDVVGTTVVAGNNAGTSIDDDDAFAARTTLRLTIGLGPDQLYTK